MLLDLSKELYKKLSKLELILNTYIDLIQDEICVIDVTSNSMRLELDDTNGNNYFSLDYDCISENLIVHNPKNINTDNLLNKLLDNINNNKNGLGKINIIKI